MEYEVIRGKIEKLSGAEKTGDLGGNKYVKVVLGQMIIEDRL